MALIASEAKPPLPSPDPIRFPELNKDENIREYLRAFIRNLEDHFDKVKSDLDVLNEPAPNAYTPTNVASDRTYDASATSTAELANVLGTLIADLQTKGILQ
jgi:hypothetical protein